MTREEIIQNIKARISTIESYHPEEYALNQGNLFELKDLLLMIEKDEPSLPSNLDEAEFEYAQSLDEMPANQEEEEMIYNAFKAGAEWQKEQDDKLVDIIYQQGIEKGKDEMRETLKKNEK